MAKDKTVTMYDVAKKANVSSVTVSRVVNMDPRVSVKTRQHVLSVIKELNYYPNANAVNITKTQPNTIALVSLIHENIFQYFYFLYLLNGIETACQRFNYDVYIPTTIVTEKRFDLKSLYFSKKVGGLIILDSLFNDSRIKDLIKNNVPFVLIKNNFDNLDANYIAIDPTKGIIEIVDYLYKLGHQKIGYINGPKDHVEAKNRFKGFKTGMEILDLKPNRQWIKHGNFSQESGKEKALEILSMKNRPSAIICANDYIAMGVISAARKLGIRIPEDLSVTGFDDIPDSMITDPPLTTMRVPTTDIGKQAVISLIDIIEGGTNVQKVVLPTTLKIRGTCDKPR